MDGLAKKARERLPVFAAGLALGVAAGVLVSSALEELERKRRQSKRQHHNRVDFLRPDAPERAKPG